MDAKIKDRDKQTQDKNTYNFKVQKDFTLPSAIGDAENVLPPFFGSSSATQSEHKKWSNFFASSIVMPMQEGWNLQEHQSSKYDIQEYLQTNLISFIPTRRASYDAYWGST